MRCHLKYLNENVADPLAEEEGFGALEVALHARLDGLHPRAKLVEVGPGNRVWNGLEMRGWRGGW